MLRLERAIPAKEILYIMNETSGLKLDGTDRKMLDILQEEFPLSLLPFDEIGNKVGLSGEEVKARISALKANGYIRRIGAVIDAKKLGYSSLLCATSVKADMIDVVAASLNNNPSVTHNYEREATLNLWFTITMKTTAGIDRFLKDIEQQFAIRIYRFPEKRTFKIKTHFLTTGE